MPVELLDLSSNNGHVDFHKVKAAGYVGVWLKATEGENYVDKLYGPNHLAAVNAGLHVGAYHFARPDLHPKAAEKEACNFCKTVGHLRSGLDLRPVLDFETHSSGDLTNAQMVEWARAFNGYVKARLGAWPLFYTFPAFIMELKPKLPIGGGLWLASWGVNDGKFHKASAPKPWKSVLVQQYTSKGEANGVAGNVDISRAAKLDPLIVSLPANPA